ncbi:YeeE/YedE thiosulfate transporter family protein [Turneriella parva]|uniref:Uncharacterized protein n=1 Tax=Turneriella parva (strain ATCC BAA-1111 / DSM 21527 / NCTC 11395 / H) TaxID=869212 RepID=I4B9X0_TURPD|nr:YeeE/YedE thiosulfate transporter family protein [Turneriella parva]AFM14077.1 hypothetical protein Turpa_3440 [Turneriella parva DSM 21527]
MEFMIPGLLFGYASAKGKFCLNSGFADAAKGDFRKFNILLVAILGQIILLPIFLRLGYVPLHFSSSIIGILIGGFLFGLLMPVAGGCTAGAMFKAGSGDTVAVASTVGFLAAIGVAYHTPAKIWLGKLEPTLLPAPDIEMRYFFAVGSIVFLLYLLFRAKDAKPNGADWSWKRTAGLVSLALTLHAILSGLRGKAVGVFFIPGFIDLWTLNLSPDLFFLLAVPLGAMLTLVGSQKQTWQRISIRNLLSRLLAGFGLGLAAAIAGGCSVGYSLGLLPSLSLHALAAISSIFLGRMASLQMGKYYAK